MNLKGTWIFDLDSTLNNLGEVWIGWYNNDYGDSLTNADILSWDTYKYVKPECGKDIYDYLHIAELYMALTPQLHSQEVVEGLVADGLDVLVVSSCTPASYIPKVAFLQRYFKCIPSNNFISAYRKDLIIADGIVDDKYETVAKYPGRRILYKQPWNETEWRADRFTNGVLIADGWEEVDKLIRTT